MNALRHPVGWFEIYVQDMSRAKTFYEKTLGVTFQKLESPALEMWAFPMLDAPGCPGALVHYPGKDSGIGGTLIYFSCADCATETARAAKNRGQIVKPKFAIGPYGHISLGLDTEGDMIGLHSMR